jgi:hypothetical protein
MGVYAESNITIECKTHKDALVIKRALEIKMKLWDLTLISDGEGYFKINKIEVYKSEIYGEMDSGRIQNLKYQCGQLWEFIKDSKGVLSLNCPFLVEGDGEFFSIEDEK